MCDCTSSTAPTNILPVAIDDMFDDISSVADAPRLLIRPMADEETSTVFHQCVHGSGPCATLGGVAGGCVHYCCHGEYSIKCVQ